MWMGGILPISDKESFGLGYLYRDAGKSGEEKIEDHSYAMIMSYGRKLCKNIGIGGSIKYIYDYYMGLIATTFALDVGILYKLVNKSISMGMSIQNLGSKGLRYKEDENFTPLPSLVRIGIGIKGVSLLRRRKVLNFISDWILTFDLVRDLVGKEHPEWWYSGGNEVVFNNTFSGRIGYFSGGGRNGVTYGCGVKLGILCIDIASDEKIYGFPTENYRVQITLTSSERKKKNKKTDILIASTSSLFIPGAGQFYNGEEMKGLIFSIGGFVLGEIYCEQKERTNTIGIGLGILHLISIMDALYEANKEDK
jgi:hypothetical protein